MNIPLVSVICTCYNHREYIQEALDSVVRQDYPSVELVIIDNGSWDDSARHIESWAERSAGRIAVTTIIRASPINYCRSFNQALALISGKYVIDLSGDDALLSSHIRSARSEEHTSELQSRENLVCRLLLEKKKQRSR